MTPSPGGEGAVEPLYALGASDGKRADSGGTGGNLSPSGTV